MEPCFSPALEHRAQIQKTPGNKERVVGGRICYTWQVRERKRLKVLARFLVDAQ